MNSNDDRAGDMVRGALAGMVATWVMGKVTTMMYEREDVLARHQEDALRNDRTAYGVAAEKVAGAVGRELTGSQRERAGTALHWSLGAGAGALYGAVRPRVPLASAGRGTLFGSTVFLLADELANPVFGLTPGPRQFPWQAHVRGFVGHLVFGLALDAGLRLLDDLG